MMHNTNMDLKKNNLYIGDCIKLSKKLANNSIDLVITSPPYADTVKYGEKVQNFKSYQYVDWITDLFDILYDKVKDDGSFILNINDKIESGLRSTYVYQLIISISNYTKWKLYDRYVWYKKSTLPSTNKKRLNDRIEYIFHFVKFSNNFKSNMDAVREPYQESSLKRFKNNVHGNDKILSDGTTILTTKKQSIPNPKGTKPITVFRFDTCSALRGIKHPAPFHPQLPNFFIKWLTEKNDLVLDPFVGSGTTAISCIMNNRKYIGFDINSKYIKDSRRRIQQCLRIKK